MDSSTQKKITRELKLCIADALHRLNRLEECIAILQECLNGESKDKQVLIRLGLAYCKKQALPDALEAFRTANLIDPEDLEIVANRITILKDLGHFKQAEELIKTLSNVQQLQADVAQATAGLFMAQNKLVEATRLFQNICEQRPNNVGIGSTGLPRCGVAADRCAIPSNTTRFVLSAKQL